MIRAFLDASVLFAASYSRTGAAREIIRHAFQGAVGLVLSDDILKEVERNLSAKAPAALPVFREVVNGIPFEVVNPTIAEVQEAATYTAAKDAPIVAAARSAGTDYLVSLDRKHLVYAAGLSEKCGVKIVLPQELLAILRGISSGT